MPDELLAVYGCQNPKRTADVVFVHGLNGNPYGYWSYQGKRDHWWPEWLGEDLPDVGVWSLGYENAAFKSRAFSILRRSGFRGFAMPLTDRAKNVLLRLETGRRGERIGERPLVFVAHSMGGLLVKQLLHTAQASPNPRWQAIAKQTSGVCFIATPHIGSDLARWASYFRTVLGTNVSMDELRPHEPLLRDLQEWYSNFAGSVGARIKTISFYEMKPTPGVGLVVQPGDANPGVPNAGLYPLSETHGSICTPASKEDLIYTRVLEFVTHDCLQEREGQPPASEEDHGQAAPPSEAVRWPSPGGDPTATIPWRKVFVAALGVVALILGIVLFNQFVFDDPGQGSSDRANAKGHPGASGPKPVDASGSGNPETAVRSLEAPAPLQASLIVRHYRQNDLKGPPVSLGEFGTKTVSARLGDVARVEYQFSTPAFAYLLALNPDGLIQPCEPTDPHIAPTGTSSRAFPADAEEFFAFTDGKGLQAFLLVASRDPLPPFAEWAAARGLNWRKLPAAGAWSFDGQRWAPKPGQGEDRGEIVRIPSVPSALSDACRQLTDTPGVEAVRAIAFPVE